MLGRWLLHVKFYRVVCYFVVCMFSHLDLVSKPSGVARVFHTLSTGLTIDFYVCFVNTLL